MVVVLLLWVAEFQNGGTMDGDIQHAHVAHIGTSTLSTGFHMAGIGTP
jgi:hypothetical protein